MATQAPLPQAGIPQNDADHIGSASMLPDGTLHMQLRAVAEDGSIGEMLMIVNPADEGYDGYVKHLGGIQPGQHRSIPPFGAA